MLRCSHATALRTQFPSSAVLRTPLSSRLAKTPRSYSLLAPAPNPTQIVAFQTKLPQLRLYSTEFGEDNRGKDSHPELDGELLPPDWNDNPASQRHKHKISRGPKLHGPFEVRRAKGDDPLVKVAMGKAKPAARTVIQIEMKWIKDRVMLAQRVRRLLNKHDIGLAAGLVQAAQHQGMDCCAAWNDILAYCLDNGSPVAAWKFWNKMKKIGNRPNAYSYTIMLQGISKNQPYPGFNPVVMAHKVYQGLKAPNSKVEPSTIINNAMLSVCARHDAMDRLWEIAGELPEEGAGSPDDITFTIILNAIRTSLHNTLISFRDSPGVTKEMVRRRRFLAVADGKRIWRDVAYRWKNGQLEMKEQLVGAMAGILLEGPEERHLYEIYDLYRQTTGIPNFSRIPGDTLSMRLVAYRNSLLFRTKDDIPFVDTATEIPPVELEPDELAGIEEEERGEFESVFNQLEDMALEEPYFDTGAIPASSPMYMPISNRTLTRLLDVALLTHDYGGIGKRYWDHLTENAVAYRVIPDTWSCLAYLRILRLTRSAKATVTLFRTHIIPSGSAQGLLFHIAMSVCRRDRKNYNILTLANELMALMNEHLVLPDARVVTGYLDLVNSLILNPHYLVALKGLDEEKQALASDELKPSQLRTVYHDLQANIHLVALKTLRPVVNNLKVALEELMRGSPRKSHGPKGVEKPTIKIIPQSAQDIIYMLQIVRRLYDSALETATADYPSQEDLKWIKEEAISLRKYSNVQISERYGTRQVYPTAEQRREFMARRNAAADVTKEEQAEDSDSQQFPPFETPETQLQEAQTGKSSSQEPQACDSQESQHQEPEVQEVQAKEVQSEKETKLQQTQVDESPLQVSQVEEPQSAMTQAEGKQVDETLSQELQSIETQPSEIQTAETQPEESRSQENQPQQTQPQSSLPEDAQVEEPQLKEQPQESPAETPLPEKPQAEEPNSQESRPEK
ncbi:hypothetical protein BJX64DRAFT_250771 [Aspergillus heterothallicus]